MWIQDSVSTQTGLVPDYSVQCLTTVTEAKGFKMTLKLWSQGEIATRSTKKKKKLKSCINHLAHFLSYYYIPSNYTKLLHNREGKQTLHYCVRSNYLLQGYKDKLHIAQWENTHMVSPLPWHHCYHTHLPFKQIRHGKLSGIPPWALPIMASKAWRKAGTKWKPLWLISCCPLKRRDSPAAGAVSVCQSKRHWQLPRYRGCGGEGGKGERGDRER